MKLASINNGTRDGQLVVVSKDLSKAVVVTEIAATMQAALDQWATNEPLLKEVYDNLNAGKLSNTIDFTTAKIMAPIPRAYHWADGSAYVTHVELVRKARNAELPESFWTDPLMYMGASDAFIGATDDILIEKEEWGIDFESEVAVITDDVPPGVDAQTALKHIKLVTILNDVSLRNLIPAELGKQFGFYQSKPWTTFAPVMVTLDELGEDWKEGKLHLPLHSTLNGILVGSPNAGVDMTFNFGQLVAHAAKTRSLMAGTVIGSGTVANQGSPSGSSCLAEVRCLETIKDGKPSTPFMQFGDRIEIEMMDKEGKSIFGRINQVVKEYKK
ncbi:fumarylacetoacetate hydrolase family protein [Myroides sp. 1354]|uniref:fumarylacetoacetate hydrolase family protein n=1 Tax=unclassified Myroides TaxID=2642485 RepID=UPI002574D929|nr:MULTISPECIES: fumarylacetoacetate hydrolase family protein [unclassified Myroides]MDM1044567.1 fumarylacetoacetate hydrolase family protein [Myroides sp. R163-1]MDM1055280.1 fumarylacetoacetate hydrolase family protein [Myroides sp. 1354]MDM1068577.1 fumarylacetoacetate hydrolase family protein [Myroides sp. 1372]